jgi:6-phosphogluconolactonase
MTRPEVKILEDPAAVAGEAAERFRALAAASIAERGAFRVALAGGSSPRKTYELLASPELSARIEWSPITVLFGDERMVPPDHADSNYRMAFEVLLSRVPLPEGNVHRVRGEAESAKLAAREYEEVLAGVFGRSPGDEADHPAPVLDLVLLGIGPDAHTASLFPESPALIERKRWVVENAGPPPLRERVTLTFPVLNAARSVVFLATGREKADAVRRVLKGGRDPWRFPAQGVQPDPGALIFLVDRLAASQL